MTDVNHEPGPSMTQSASRTAVEWPRGTARGRWAGSRSTRRCRARRRRGAGRAPRPVSSGRWRVVTTDLGDDLERLRRHRQHPAPRARAGDRRGRDPATVSPSSSQIETIMRLPRACPARSPAPAKRCWRTSRHVWPQSLSSQSADSAIRRSPGGSTSNSSRSRPLDPPSSATVTTAVTRSVSRRNAVQRGRQTVPATERDDAAVVGGDSGADGGGGAVGHERVGPVTHARGRGGRRRCRRRRPTEAGAQRLGDRDRAVLAAGAPDGHGDVATALAHVARRSSSSSRPAARSRNSSAPGCSMTNSLTGVVAPGQRPQLGHPVGVGQEAHVEDDVGVEGQAVLEAERHDGDAQLRRGGRRRRATTAWRVSWCTLSPEVSMTTSA